MITTFANQVFRSVAGGILASQARNLIGTGSKNIKGTIRGLANNRGPFSKVQRQRRYMTNDKPHLTFPFDVEFSPQGHYVLFEIKRYEPAKIDAVRHKLKTAEAVYSKFQSEQSGLGYGDVEAAQDLVQTNQIANLKGEVSKLIKAGHSSGSQGAQRSALRVINNQTKHTKQIIALYMPPSISTSYRIKYADPEIGIMAETGLKAFQAFMGAKGDFSSKLTAAGKDIKGDVRIWAKSAALKAIDAFATGSRALHQIQTGTVITPRMELMFEGVGRRSFTYTFVFIPKSEGEAQEVEKIVYAFKEAMHPAIPPKANYRSMTIPDTFNIKYMTGGGRNAFINKISSCFLQSMDVQYGADRFTAYPPTKSQLSDEWGSPPQKTQITLNFSELDILTKDDIQEGY